jgi:myosin heavy subunit
MGAVAACLARYVSNVEAAGFLAASDNSGSASSVTILERRIVCNDRSRKWIYDVTAWLLEMCLDVNLSPYYLLRDAIPFPEDKQSWRSVASSIPPSRVPLSQSLHSQRTDFIWDSMATTEMEYMSSAEIAQSVRTKNLEQAYDRALREAERICEEERVRVLRVQLLLLEDENDELQERLERNEIDASAAEDQNEDLRQHLAEVDAELQHVQTELKARTRDAEKYKTEVDALNASNSDATKLLAEKFALARELNILKPEIEHLKSQATTQQNLLAEKLALQRELSSMQVELETERRTVQRIKAQDKNASNDDSALVEEVESLKKELAKAQKDAQKNDREGKKKTTELETQNETLESKLDAFRTKLRTTKEQLKEAQEELEKVQAARMAQSAELTKARLISTTAAPNPKKRNVTRFDPDMTIGTPGNGGPAKKQRISVNVGDKSTFSMTPFLNRMTDVLPDSPEPEPEKQAEQLDVNERMKVQIEEIADEAEAQVEAEKQPEPAKKAATSKAAPKAVPKNPAAPKAKQPLKETTKSKANAAVKKPTLPKVVEEDEDEDADAENIAPAEEAAEPKKKKVFNKRSNIFDDDNEGAPKIKNLSFSANTSSLGKISLVGLGKGKTKTLAEFSPLKKDRRAAQSAPVRA